MIKPNYPITKIIFIFLIWRFSLFLIAFISPFIIPQFGGRFPYYQERLIATGLPHFIWSFANFDGVHYLGIAKNAYDAQFTQVFFPLYPVLIRIFATLTFSNLIIAALLISNLVFPIGLVLFFKLIGSVYNQRIAFWSCLFLLAFPTSFYFGSVYTEGLFFLMIIASFYLYENKKILLASVVGSFASATRLAGLFLAPALALKKDLKSLLPVFVVPLGFLAYVSYLKIKFNNPLYFLTAQSIFGQERSTDQIVLLPQVFYRYLKILATTNGLPFTNAVFELSTTLFALILLVIAFKRVKFEWFLFSLLAVITPTLTGTLTSMPRYMLVAFPMFIVLAMINDFKIKLLILIVFSVLQVVATTLFTQGYWVA